MNKDALIVRSSLAAHGAEALSASSPRPATVAGFVATVALATLVACGVPSASGPTPHRVSTAVLPAPGDSASAFEPYVAIDAAAPDRIVVGAQYGLGYNRGGLRFWIWASGDAGRTWQSSEVVPRMLRRPSTMAADLSLAYSPDGAVFLFGISGDTVRAVGGRSIPEAALALAVSHDGVRTFIPRALVGEPEDLTATVFAVSDKPWMAVDGNPRSPYSGSLYLAWTRVTVRLDTDPPTIARRLVLRASRDQGRQIAPSVSLADEGLGVQLAVRPDGTVDVVWLEWDASAAAGATARVLHAASRDGGASFSSPEVVERVADTTETLDLPTLAVNPAGELLACWVRGPASAVVGTTVRCSQFQEARGWSMPAPAVPAPSGTALGYPAVAATREGWWLLSYQADSVATRVLLLRSEDGRRFEVSDTLAEVALSLEGFCPRPMLACRADLRVFSPGDYVALAAAPERLAAAYVMPRDGEPEGRAEVWLSVIDLGAEAASRE